MVGVLTARLCQPAVVQALTGEFSFASGVPTARSICVSTRKRHGGHAVTLTRREQGQRAGRRSAMTEKSAATTTAPPVKEVPGSWDTPGYDADVEDLFYKQGWYEFFATRQKQYGNVFKTNLGPIEDQAQVIVLLDQASYPILYDNSKVLKKNLFFGKYVPELATYTNDQRVCAYLDPSEELHFRIKSYAIALLAKYGPKHVSTPKELLKDVFNGWEAELSEKGKVEVSGTLLQFMWDWHLKAFGGPPFKEGSKHSNDWAGAALTPLINLPGPVFVEKALKKIIPTLRKLKSPKKDFDALLAYFSTNLPEAVNIGTSAPINLTREQAITNLTFFIAFNARNALASSFDNAIVEFAQLDAKTKAELVAEVAAGVKKSGGEVTFQALQEMPLLESFVYEIFRLHPPVNLQHAEVKEDTVIQSSSGSYQLRAGQLLLGQCYFASRDPAVFDKPDTFDIRRFLGENKDKNLKHVLWSNGFQDVAVRDTLNNKQCPGKDFVPILVRVFMAHFLSKYKDVELTGPVGWSKTKFVPGPMLEGYSLKGAELYVKSLTKV